jgi:hypothetical protein
MKPLFVTVLTVALGFALLASSFAKDKKKPEEAPVQWGLLSRAAGCVIFKETHKIDVKSFGPATTETSYNVLDMIETASYEMAQQHWIEDRNGIDQLQRLAADEHLAMIKIRDGYSPALLDKARAMCAASISHPH